MNKYIPTGKLIAEIERQFKSIENATGDFAEGRRWELDNLHKLITYLQQEQPSLPSNLDEAANNFGFKETLERLREGEITRKNEGMFRWQVEKSFKAGAEWMAGQGVTVECGVRVYPTLDGESHPWVSLYKNGINVDSLKDIPGLESLGFEDGDKAIVQIRKK